MDGLRSFLDCEFLTVNIPICARRPLDMSVRFGSERLIEAASRNDRLAPAACQMRHWRAALAAERGSKASRVREIIACYDRLASNPSEGGGLDDHLARMCCTCCLTAARAMAIEKLIKRSIDLE